MTNIRNHTRDHTREHLRDMVEGLGGINFDLYSFYVDFPETIDQVSKNSPSIVFDAGGVGYSPNFTGGGLNQAVFEESGAVLSGGAFTQLARETEDISGSTWSNTDTTVTGTSQLVSSITTATHITFQQTSTNAATGIYTSFIEVKKIDHRYVFFQNAFTGGAERYGIIFDLDTGLVTDENELGSPTTKKYTIENRGDGWYRLTLTSSNVGPANTFIILGFSDSATPAYTANKEVSYLGTGSSFYATVLQGTQSTYPLPYLANSSAVATISAAARFSGATGGIKYTIEGDLLDSLDGVTDGITLNSGNIVALTRYIVITTEVDHFGAGVVVGDRITGLTTALDANNTVQTLLDAQGTMELLWTPKFDWDDTSVSGNIISWDNTIATLFHRIEGVVRFTDGTNSPGVDIDYQVGTQYTIILKWGSHPDFSGASKLFISITDGPTTWDSPVVDFVGTFSPEDFLSLAWENEYFQEIKLIGIKKEVTW